MQNLVENAVKYGSTAAPIEVTVARTHDGGSITVRDHGPGIPRDAQARVFERFYRQQVVEGSRPGLGLGLFLARRLADRLGGRLSLESEVGHGAAFTFALPADVPESVASHHREPTAPMRWSPPDHEADN
jgi:signal transduction histidine kinase